MAQLFKASKESMFKIAPYRNFLAFKQPDPEEVLLETPLTSTWKEEGGCKRLCQAVILRAATDVGLSPRLKGGFTGKRKPVSLEEEKDVYKWFFSDNEEEFSFIWCAQAVSSNTEKAEALIEALRREIEEQVECLF